MGPTPFNGNQLELGTILGGILEVQRQQLIVLVDIKESLAMPAQREGKLSHLISSMKELAREVYPIMALLSLSLTLLALILGKVTWAQIPQIVGIAAGH